MRDAVLVRAAVAIQNYGSSGTLLVQSLLDGHPNLLGTPALYSRDYYAFWESLTAEEQASNRRLVDAFVLRHAYWFSADGAVRAHGLHQLGPAMAEAVHVPEDQFRRALGLHLERLDGHRRRALLTASFLAYADALGRTIRSPALLVFPIHSLPRRHAVCLVEDFADTRFLHVVREPVQTIGSLLRHIVAEQLPVNPLECACAQLLNDHMKHWGPVAAGRVYGDRPYFPDWSDRARAVRLEDVHTRARETLQAVCDWLGIPWDDCLLESTFDGKRWWNRPGSIRVAGLGTQTISQRHEDLLNDFDRARLRAIAGRKRRVWRYDAGDAPRTGVPRWALPLAVLVPFKAEAPGLRHHLRCGGRHAAARVTAWLERRLSSALARDARDLNRRVRHFRMMRLLVVALVPFAVAVAARDYVMVRWWLYRALLDRRSGGAPEVRLLEIDRVS